MLMQRTFECRTASILVRVIRGVTHDPQATKGSEDPVDFGRLKMHVA